MKLALTVKAKLLSSLMDNRGITVDILATKTGIDPSKIESYIVEDSDIEQTELELIAKAFHKPWTVFLLDKPELRVKQNDNRTHRSRGQALGAELVKFIEDTEFMIELSNEIDPTYTIDFPVTLTSKNNPESIAEKLREIFDTNDEFKKSFDSREALGHWKRTVQSHGVYITERALPTDQVRAFSMRKGDKAAIVLSTKDSYTARTFSLFHEVGHVLLRNTGICDLHNTDSHDVEQFCNKFSAAFLAPRTLVKQIIEECHEKGLVDKDDLIRETAGSLKISRAAAAVRLSGLGIIGPVTYLELEKLQNKKKKEGRSSGGNYYATTINAAGVAFSKQVFNAVAMGSIGTRDAARFLGVGEKNLGNYRTTLYGYHPENGKAN